MDEDRGEYCRRVEAHLCRKNDGHLIRLVGPAFMTVSGWAERGVPLTIACQGIDRYFERYYAKGPRRRPVQIQFCDADVLELFDDWRRAIGLRDPRGDADDTDAGGDTGSQVPRHGSLAAHLERAIARVTMLRGGGALGDETIDRIVRELDVVRTSARGLRGQARERVLDRLREVDAELLAEARRSVAEADVVTLRAEAASELAPFRARMPPDAFERAMATSVDRLLRTRMRIPDLAFD